MSRSRKIAYSLRDLVARLGGELVGDASVTVEQIAPIESAGTRDLGFVSQERWLPLLQTTAAGAVVVGPWGRNASPRPHIVADNPYLYFARALTLFNPPQTPKPGIHKTAVVAKSARVARSVHIGPHVVIGEKAAIGASVVIDAGCTVDAGAEIGAGTRLYPNVVVYRNCVLGKRVVVHAGAVIGSDGFGNARDGERWIKIPQLGRVVIGDDVEIGANTTIDRGTLGDTVIEEGVKLDNQIQIAHNVRIGAHTAMAACVGVAGSVTIGRNCTVGGAGMISGHLTIGDRINVSGGTLVAKSLHKPGTYTAVYPLEEYAAWRRNAAQVRHLDEMAERLRKLERMLAELKRGKS